MNRIILISFIIILAGCDNGKIRDVQYFIEHPEERKEIFEKCKNNPGKLRNTPECINVSKANKEVTIQEIQRAVRK